jgi:hypothetical protein
MAAPILYCCFGMGWIGSGLWLLRKGNPEWKFGVVLGMLMLLCGLGLIVLVAS